MAENPEVIDIEETDEESNIDSSSDDGDETSDESSNNLNVTKPSHDVEVLDIETDSDVSISEIVIDQKNGNNQEKEEEPIILLESVQLPETNNAIVDNDRNLNIDEFDCFVDPEEVEEAQNLEHETETNNATSLPDLDIEPFTHFEDADSTTSNDPELFDLICNNDEKDDEQALGDDLSKSLLNESNEDCDIQDQNVNICDFVMLKNSIYVTAESLKVFVPLFDLNNLVEKIEDKGWRVSDCLKFSEFNLNLIKLNVALMIAPESSLLKKLLSQLMSSECFLDRKSKIPDICLLSLREKKDQEVVEVVDENDVEAENEVENENLLEVTQTREMKRKGIKLPRGWKIYGKRIESEISSKGGTYSYFRIDWQYRSPDGKLYNNLKTVLSVIRQKCVKYERWELVAPVTKEKSETHGKSQYVTLRQQYEDELDRALDTDVFAVSGIRPVRKFPVNFEHPKNNNVQASTAATDPDPTMPSRMSAMLKSNPITLAQQEKMMRKAGPAIQRFQLNKVSEVQGQSQEGWFSSKMVAMKYLSQNSFDFKLNMIEQNPLECFTSTFGKVKLKFIDENETAMIKSLKEYLREVNEFDKDAWNDENSQDSDIFKRATSRCQSRMKILPNFTRKIFRNHKWPRSWMIRLSSENNLLTYISPEGNSFENCLSALNSARLQPAMIAKTNEKTLTPNKRKMFNLNTPQKTPSVVRKLASNRENETDKKRMRISDGDIEAFVFNNDFYDTDDSLENLLSGSDEEVI